METSLFGKSRALLRLNQILDERNDKKLKHKILSLIDDFYKGTKVLNTIPDKTLFSAFYKIYVKEIKSRADYIEMDRVVKTHLLSSISGLGRSYYRNIQIKNNWCGNKRKKLFASLNDKHSIEYTNCVNSSDG